MATDYKTFYSDELRRLRRYSQEFARNNPAIAPMLGTPSVDPDIERLLEGVAFLNGHTRQKLEDEFPEIAQELSSILMPQILRPVPAATMMVFEPKTPLEDLFVRAGTELSSVPIDGVRCQFQTVADLQVHSARLLNAGWTQAQDGRSLLKLELLTALTAAQASLPDSLRFYLGENADVAASLLMLLDYYCEKVELVDQRGNRYDISGCLKFPGFEQTLVSQPVNALPSFGLIRELLFFPEKFLFFELRDLSQQAIDLRSEKFSIEFRFGKFSHPLPDIGPGSLQLNVVPAINLFKTSAEPIDASHESPDYLVLPSGVSREYYQIFSIDSVIGLTQGQAEQTRYQPFSWMQYGQDKKQVSTYRTSIRPSMSGDLAETYIALVYEKGTLPTAQTLSIELQCTNRWLPERLKLGEVCAPTNSSPERCTFRNITPVKGSVDVPADEGLLWACICHTAINFMSLGTVQTVRSLLRLYNSFKTNDPATRMTNERQIEGILDVQTIPETRLHRGSIIRGQVLKLLCDQSKWPSAGAMYLWGSVLARFFASYANINTYTRVEMQDANSGAQFKWPPMLGSKPSI
jgi:type VI secretion system protein ImpG